MPRLTAITYSITRQVRQYEPVRIEVTMEPTGNEPSAVVVARAREMAEMVMLEAIRRYSNTPTGPGGRTTLVVPERHEVLQVDTPEVATAPAETSVNPTAPVQVSNRRRRSEIIRDLGIERTPRRNRSRLPPDLNTEHNFPSGPIPGTEPEPSEE